MQELWLLRSAYCLRLIYVYMKWLEDSLNRFQVLEQTLFCDRQSSKGNISKSMKARVMVLEC